MATLILKFKSRMFIYEKLFNIEKCIFILQGIEKCLKELVNMLFKRV